MPGTAFSTSTSSSMIAADLPPSSSVTRRMSRPQSSAMRLPTGVLPVKLTLSTPGWVTRPLALRRVGDEHVDDPGRQARLLDGLREDVAGEPVLHRRLEDHRAARRERGRRLLRAQRQRPVERRDQRPPRRPARAGPASMPPGSGAPPRTGRSRDVGVRPEVDRGHRRHVALGEGDRVPVLLHPELGELAAGADRGGRRAGAARRPARPATSAATHRRRTRRARRPPRDRRPPRPASGTWPMTSSVLGDITSARRPDCAPTKRPSTKMLS